MLDALAPRHRTALRNASRLTNLASDATGTSYDQTIGLAYNNAGQIKSRTASNDAYAWTGAANVTRGYTANGLNQFTASGATSLGYDGRGNLTSSGSDSYSYSSENLLTVLPDRHVRGMKLVYDGANVIGQSNGTTVGRRYVMVPG